MQQFIKTSENSIWHFLKSSTSCGFHFFHCLQISLFSDLMPFSRTLPNHSTFFCGAPFYRISLLFLWTCPFYHSVSAHQQEILIFMHHCTPEQRAPAHSLSCTRARDRDTRQIGHAPFYRSEKYRFFMFHSTHEQRTPPLLAARTLSLPAQGRGRG